MQEFLSKLNTLQIIFSIKSRHLLVLFSMNLSMNMSYFLWTFVTALTWLRQVHPCKMPSQPLLHVVNNAWCMCASFAKGKFHEAVYWSPATGHLLPLTKPSVHVFLILRSLQTVCDWGQQIHWPKSKNHCLKQPDFSLSLC